MAELADKLHLFEAYDLTLIVLGLGVLALSTLLHQFESRPFSFPLIPLGLGWLAFALPLGLSPPDPHTHGDFAVHLTEIGVIISLMGVGLKIDRVPHWRTWITTWRLLIISMPLTIIGVAYLGWWLAGLTPAAAILLGAALAPTDPVLASDLQVGEPEAEVPPGENPASWAEKADQTTDGASTTKTDPTEKEDELRFTLTSEAGLNDGLAFPFTYLALLLLGVGTQAETSLSHWVLVDVIYRIVVGVGAGILVGWGLSRILLRLPVDTEQQKMKVGVGALAATLILYGVTEMVGGYGFLAVVVGSITIRHKEYTQQAHQSLHVFAEQSEQLFMTGILIALGGAIAGGLLAPLTWQAALVCVLLIFVLRPLAGMIGLLGTGRLSWLDRSIVSFFGIRGVGCLYYLAYGLQAGSFQDEDLLWATCAFAVLISVCVHGITSAPVMRYRDRRRSKNRPTETK